MYTRVMGLAAAPPHFYEVSSHMCFAYVVVGPLTLMGAQTAGGYGHNDENVT